MKKYIRILIAVVTACLLCSCSKIAYPIDEFVGAYDVSGMGYTTLKGDTTRSESVKGYLRIYPTGKESFKAYIYAGHKYSNKPFVYKGIIENGKLQITGTEALDELSSAKFTSCEKDSLTINLMTSTHNYSGYPSTVTLDLVATR